MPVFAYKGRTVNGQVEAGTLEVPTRDDAVRELRRRRLIATNLKEQRAWPFRPRGLRGRDA